ncbi:hypothetical protein BCR33DRAFT_738286 [Rhizoclosmatium globosum]|uniref:Uncharacterized protein n=1 Tax=Rhizoclosmatium globosum TaxID=329046 RepID=A0A1Y2CCS6_9FUNG|nr:hypothetical protein BCR33DRAFT_738286 [Rhizoclosmatium globosum]|eukprot:ORY44125.1 hypothetical protein BCR33DRAFT_738286 [Rhizoclosmatium globosum]
MALADSDCLCGTDPCGVGGFCVNNQCSCGVPGFDVQNQLWKDGATCKCSPTDGELCTTGLYCTINSTCATTPNCSGGSCTTAICGSTLGNTLPLSQNFCAFQNQTCAVQADESRKCVDASAVTAVASTVVSTAISTAVSTAISTAISTAVATTVSTAVSSAVSSTASSTVSTAASNAASTATSSASTTKISPTAAVTSNLVTTSISSFNVALSSTTSSNITPSSATESPATTNLTTIKSSETSTVAKASPTSNSNSMLGTSTSPVVIQSISSATGTRTVVASSTLPLPSSTTLSPPPLPVDPPGAQNTPLTGSVKVATVNKFITILGHTFPLLNAKSIADTVKTATVFVGTNNVEGRKRDSLNSRSGGASGTVMFKGPHNSSAVAATTSAIVTTDKAFAASDITSTSSVTTVSPNLLKTMAIPSYGINTSEKQESNQINIPVPTKTPAVGGGKTNVLASSSMTVIPVFCLSLLILFV